MADRVRPPAVVKHGNMWAVVSPRRQSDLVAIYWSENGAKEHADGHNNTVGVEQFAVRRVYVSWKLI